jgi:phosphohistidine phosphatase
MGSRVIVARHAKSDYPWGVSDHDRPLNDRGRRDAPALGAWLEDHVDWPQDAPPIVVVSTARRAQLTWGLASAELSARWVDVRVIDEPRVYEAGVQTLRSLVVEYGALTSTLLMVGHNPGLAYLILDLAAPSELREEATRKFPTSAVAVLESELPLPQAAAGSGGFSVSEFAVPRG